MLAQDRVQTLVAPYLVGYSAAPADLYQRLATYLELLARWNFRTNLTAIRDPEEMVRRHFGESLFAGVCLSRLSRGGELLDVGTGAGFPGLPLALLLPDFRVTLAESQGKKVAFLREVVRALDVGVEVWAGRVEAMPVDRRFDVVTLRAVDRMTSMLGVSRARLKEGGLLLEMTTGESEGGDTWRIPGTDRALVRGVRLRGCST